MNLEGLTEKKNHMGTTYFQNGVDGIMLKTCTGCEELKPLNDFSKQKKGLGGRRSICKSCVSINRPNATEYLRKWREENKERQIENSRNWYKANKERLAELTLTWQRNNRDKVAIRNQRRRARKKSLLDSLTTAEYEKTLEYFGKACALTGETQNLEKEHAIPISIGHGGTTFENCYPLRADLNASKSNANIFEWFEANRQRFNLSQGRFDRLIEWLGKANDMTVEEYRDYVYWCHANPRNIDEDNEQQAI